MTAGDAAGVTAGPAVARNVLRAALVLLRRHAFAFAALGLALGVLPGVASLQALPRLVPDDGVGGVGVGADVLTLMRGISGIAVVTLAYLSGTALDVAVVAVALGRGHEIRPVLRLVARVLPVDAFCLAASLALSAAVPAAPPAVWGVILAAFGSWSILLPAFVAERLRLRDLPRRGLALVRRRHALAVALYACNLAVASAVAADAFGLAPDYPVASVGGWARAFAWSGAGYAAQVAGDAAFTALYLALRRDEGAALGAEVAAAFE